MDTWPQIRRTQCLTQAEGYLELGMADHALAVLSKLDPETCDHRHVFYLRGEALRSLERYEEAIEPLAEASRRMPDNIHVWLAVAWCYKRTGQIDLAIDALENALETDPSEAILHYNLACYWALLGNKRQVLTYLTEAFEIDCNYRDLVAEERDFDPLRGDPDFEALLTVIV